MLTELDVAALVARITDPDRLSPVVVVTTGGRAFADRLSPERIVAAAGAGIEVAVLPTGTLTWSLERGLPDGTSVFGDAARTYPTGSAWTRRPELAPLRFCRADSDARQVEGVVIADARAARRDAALRDVPPPPGSQWRGSLSTSARRSAPAGSIAPPRLERPSSMPARHDPDAPVRPSEPAPTPATLPRAAARPAGAGAAVRSGRTTAGVTTGPKHPGSRRGRLGGSELWQVRTDQEGRELAAHLTGRARTHPVVVVTTPREDAPPLLDALDLFTRVGRVADVVILHNGPASWAFAQAMPPMTEVYGGAGRVYPVDPAWLTDPYRAPIRFCWPGDDLHRVADQLEDDAYASANLAGLLTSTSAASTRAARGRVESFVGRHHVALSREDGGVMLLLIDQLFPGVEPPRLLRTGQLLAGRIETGWAIAPFTPDPIADDPAARVRAAYAAGDLVLARVDRVEPDHARALLHPEVAVTVHAGDDEPDLRNLIAADDVVVLMLHIDVEGRLGAELADTAAASRPCLPVLPDGPSWLLESDLRVLEPVSPAEAEPTTVLAPPGAREPTAPKPAGGPAPVPGPTPTTIGIHAQLAALQKQVGDLTSRLAQERAEAQRQTRAAAMARDEAKRLRSQVKSLRDQHAAYRARTEGTAVYADPGQQLRHEIQQAWLQRVPEPQRGHLALTPFRLGAGFLTSLTELQGISREKVVDVLVEVLTGLAKDVPGRELHPLRESTGVSEQRVRGSDGARAWRCALQVNTPSARRLHFWRLPDGTIELDEVGSHDGTL